MKNNILIFLLGIFVTISIAATIPNTGLLTVKPATPKSVISFYGYRASPEEVVNKINKYSKYGYVVKEMVGSDYSYIIVMEKY